MVAFVLVGHVPLTALAQSPDLSDVKTALTDHTDTIDSGRVISRSPDSITVKNDLFTRVFRIGAQTEIDRVDSSQIQIGDLVGIRCHLDDRGTAVADSISANVDRWDGVITKVVKDTAYIKFDAPGKKTVRVVFDRGTEFGYCLGIGDKRDCSLDDLKVGRYLETVGYVLGKKELLATRVLHIQNH
jgi:hypothetical protein